MEHHELLHRIASNEDVGALVSYLKEFTPEDLVAAGPALQELDPARQAAAYLFLLHAHWQTSPRREELWPATVSFLHAFHGPQIVVCLPVLLQLVETVAEWLQQIQRPQLLVRPLRAAIAQLAPSPTHLTPLHPLFLAQCLVSKTYSEAAPILELDLHASNKTHLSYEHFLLHHYYAACIYMGQKEYVTAYDSLSLTLAAPGAACSTIQVEAYKKYILMAILCRQSIALPPGTAQPVSRAVKSLCKPYEALAAAGQKAPSDMTEAYEKACDVFTTDGNLGLVHLCLEAYRKHHILSQTKTYVTLSLQQLAAQDVTWDTARDTHSLMLSMIQGGEIFATLHEDASGATMVSFHEEDLPRLSQLEHELAAAQKTSRQMAIANRHISLRKDYIAKTQTRFAGSMMEDLEMERCI